ncbi:MAG TPA: hydrogenase iron-sulfur subunit [bacterium]|nr:hydrogenase iron-sulfur subunit [bacterium]
MADESFEPKLVGFLCRWCTYTGADLAGISRIKYPPNLTAIKVMCSGRVDPTFIVQAFADGADGVLIGGCHPGDCHYDVGNYRTMRRYPMLVKLLGQFGIEPDRVWLRWISASEGNLFADTIRDMTARIKELGPLNWTERTRAINEAVT